MRILVACEESQEVCKAFRERGHRAFSCDIQECSGGHPEWHIMGDCLEVINPKPFYEEYGDEQSGKHDVSVYKGIKFVTMDEKIHFVEGTWDLIIAHPPCTDLAVSGARHFAQKQKDGRQQKSIVFFMQLALAHCDHVAVENPVSIMSSAWRKPDQIIQPYMFGHPESKKTCLWLKGLPLLKATDLLELPVCGYWSNQTKDGQNKLIVDGKWIAWNDPRTAKERSKTYSGIAKAMAEQWGGIQ